MRRNVVLLVLDTVRKDHFDRYAPRLQDLGDASFDRCYAASSWSAPSHASTFTGELAHRDGVHAHNLDFSTLSTAETFLFELPDHQTVRTSTNLFAGPSFEFDSLFDEFWNASRNGLFIGGMNIEEFSQGSSLEGAEKYKEFLREAYRESRLTRSLMNGVSVKLNDIMEATPLPRFYDYGASSSSASAWSRRTESAVTRTMSSMRSRFADRSTSIQHLRNSRNLSETYPKTVDSGPAGTWSRRPQMERF